MEPEEQKPTRHYATPEAKRRASKKWASENKDQVYEAHKRYQRKSEHYKEYHKLLARKSYYKNREAQLEKKRLKYAETSNQIYQLKLLELEKSALVEKLPKHTTCEDLGECESCGDDATDSESIEEPITQPQSWVHPLFKN